MGFDRIIADRVAAVRAAAQAPPPAPVEPPVTAVRPTATWSVLLEENPLAAGGYSPSPGEQLRTEYADLPQVWLACVWDLVCAVADAVVCARCGERCGYRTSGFTVRWEPLALVSAVEDGGDADDGAVTVQCKTCWPVHDLEPWPAAAPAGPEPVRATFHGHPAWVPSPALAFVPGPGETTPAPYMSTAVNPETGAVHMHTWVWSEQQGAYWWAGSQMIAGGQ